MSTWVFPNKPTNYDIRNDFDTIGRCHWESRIKSVKEGEIVYIYLSGNVKAIRWKCLAKRVGYYLRPDDDFTYSSIKTTEFCDGPFIELIPIIEFNKDSELGYHTLIHHGLKGAIMSGQRLSEELLDYVESVEDGLGNQDKNEIYISSLTLSDLKTIVDNQKSKTIKTSVVTTKQYNRNPYVAQYAKTRANGICQLCGKQAPFNDKNGNPYLESHHIVWLSRGGSDDIHNVVALCCNCHKKMHIVDDPKDVAYLKKQVK